MTNLLLVIAMVGIVLVFVRLKREEAETPGPQRRGSRGATDRVPLNGRSRAS